MFGVGHMPNMYGLKREALVYALKVLELSLSIKMFVRASVGLRLDHRRDTAGVRRLVGDPRARIWVLVDRRERRI